MNFNPGDIVQFVSGTGQRVYYGVVLTVPSPLGDVEVKWHMDGAWVGVGSGIGWPRPGNLQKVPKKMYPLLKFTHPTIFEGT